MDKAAKEAKEAKEAKKPEVKKEVAEKPEKVILRKKAPAKKLAEVYKVAKGKSITTKRGIKAEGAEVDASFFAEGQKTLEQLLKKRFLERK